MAPPATARDELIKIRFLDLRASLVEETLIASDTTFTDFLTLLCDLSAGVARQDVSSSQVQAGGVNLSDGHWWYRVVKQMRTIDIGHMTHEPRIVKGGWQILNNHAAYDRLLAEMTLGINAEGGWVEVQHVSSSAYTGSVSDDSHRMNTAVIGELYSRRRLRTSTGVSPFPAMNRPLLRAKARAPISRRRIRQLPKLVVIVNISSKR